MLDKSEFENENENEELDLPKKSLEEIVREVSEEEKLSEEEIRQIIDAFKSVEKVGKPKKKKKDKDKAKTKRKISKKSKRRNR